MSQEENAPTTLDQFIFTRNIPEGPLTDDQLLDLAMGRWEKFATLSEPQTKSKKAAKPDEGLKRRAREATPPPNLSPKPSQH